MGDEQLRRLETIDRSSLASAVSLICGDPVLAEEAVQEALLKAWQKAKAGAEVDIWSSWVLTVALNHTRSHFRRLGRERGGLSEASPGSSSHFKGNLRIRSQAASTSCGR